MRSTPRLRAVTNASATVGPRPVDRSHEGVGMLVQPRGKRTRGADAHGCGRWINGDIPFDVVGRFLAPTVHEIRTVLPAGLPPRRPTTRYGLRGRFGERLTKASHRVMLSAPRDPRPVRSVPFGARRSTPSPKGGSPRTGAGINGASASIRHTEAGPGHRSTARFPRTFWPSGASLLMCCRMLPHHNR